MDKLCCCNASEIAGNQISWSSGKGKSHQGQMTFGYSLVKGKANHPMEDYHVAKFEQMQEHELGLFAIFDGHMGNEYRLVAFQEEFWVDPRNAISNAYVKTDKAILSTNSDLSRGGSTAVTAIIFNGRKLWIANLGDSRAVLSKGGQALQMSVDHEPSTERGSIEDKGGFVSNLPGDVPRVNGQLAVSRAFGDKSLKSHLRSDPDVQEANIDFNADILILASDGLWKVMNNQEAVDIARKIKDPHKAAKQLAAEALKRESKDDISIIVVRFR
ncbi:putative protein phosphatase 2C 9 isoform X2 [Silene latifolia]|uniref:putative protein phosphatase 2C 9 isoform X2 n=1 Tax=Silene latifolia TaxID=37657 RepID=UPI003D76CE5D